MPSPQPGSPAPDATALDAAGEPVSFASFWGGGTIVLVFLRHWG